MLQARKEITSQVIGGAEHTCSSQAAREGRQQHQNRSPDDHLTTGPFPESYTSYTSLSKRSPEKRSKVGHRLRPLDAGDTIARPEHPQNTRYPSDDDVRHFTIT